MNTYDQMNITYGKWGQLLKYAKSLGAKKIMFERVGETVKAKDSPYARVK